MREEIFRSINLCKSYKKVKVIDDLSMNIKRGDIYGFVGKNGAGKTTMIRIILGLIKQDSGSMELFNNRDYKDINMSRRKIGSLIEKPSFYPNMTASENLELIKIQRNLDENINIAKVLELVNLNSEEKKVRNFSLGMKQRLGIAMAILSNPEFLVLDEPINGLDPIGIKEIRELLLKINKEYGTTILISSHILTELTQIATKYGFIDKGCLLKEISVEEFKQNSNNYLHLKSNLLDKTITVLKSEFNIENYNIIEGNSIQIKDNINIENLSIILARYNIAIYEIFYQEESLETYFTNLIKENCNETVN